MIVALVVVGFAAAGAVVVVALRSVDVLVRHQVRRVVVVELKSGETFKGVVKATDGRSMVLANVTLLTGEQTKPVGVDGELLIPRSDVKYLQRP